MIIKWYITRREISLSSKKEDVNNTKNNLDPD